MNQFKKTEEQKKKEKEWKNEFKQIRQQEREHLSFPQRHPNVPLIISVIALAIAILRIIYF